MSTSAPPRIVLDTNILISSIGTRSRYRWVFDALIAGRFTLCVSTPILLEYEAVLARKSTPEIGRNVLRLLMTLPTVERVEPRFRWALIEADPDDNKFVDTALMANADALVTHDAHFNVLTDIDFPRVAVLSVEAFEQRLGPAE